MDWLRGLLPEATQGPQSRQTSYADVRSAAEQAGTQDEGTKTDGNSPSKLHRIDINASSAQQDELKIPILSSPQQQPAAKQQQLQHKHQQQQQQQQQQRQQPSAARNSVLAAVYGLTNLSSVVCIVFANKLVLHTYGFRFATTLTWLHCLFSMLGMVLAAALQLFEVKRVPLQRSLPLAMAYVGSIVANNMSIQLNPVGFYQISKIAITPVIVCIEKVFYNKPVSPRVLASIAVLLSGIAAATVTDSQVASQPLGMMVAAINVVVTGLYQVWAGTKQKELGLNGLQLLHQVSPSSVALLAVLIPCLEPVGWSNPGPDTIMGYQITPAAGFWIVVSSVLGLVVTLSTFLFIGATSSLTYNVVGHLKTLLIVTGGVVLFHDTMSAKKLLGLLVAMAGIIWYSQIKMTEAAKPGKQ